MTATTTEKGQSATGDTLAAFARIRTQATDLKQAIAAAELPPLAGLKPRERVELFAAVDAAAKAAEAASKRAKDLRGELDETILATLDELGVARFPIQGGPTIYRSRELWAGIEWPDDVTDEEKPAIKAAAMDALKRAGLESYVEEGFNTQSLSAYFRDRERELESEARERDGLAPDAPVAIDPEEIVPEELRGIIRLSETIKAKAKTS